MTLFRQAESFVRSRTIAILFLGIVVLLTFGLVSPALSDDPGFALEFDGTDDYVLLDETNTIMGAGTDWVNNKSVSLWLKPTGTSPSGPTQAHLDLLLGDRPRYWGISRGEYNGQDRIWIWNFSDYRLQAIGVEYTVDEWIQVALSHSSGVLRAFKNGVEVGNVASGPTGIGGIADATLYLGGDIRSSSRNFEGQLDEVRVWNVGLDEAAIQAWMYTEINNAHP